jgi:DNA-binding XRE family transcriptional regulator
VATPQGPFYREFGRKLSLARRAARITQEALAQAVGLSRTSIVNIEKGRQPVAIDLAIRMARSLDTTMFDLLPGAKPAPKADIASELQRISPHARPWVERVITVSTFREDSRDGSEILTSKTQGQGTAPRDKSKGSSRSR